MIHQKKSRRHRTSKIVKSRQSSGDGHLPYHLFILWVSALSHGWRGMWICVHSKDAQKQLARMFLKGQLQQIKIPGGGGVLPKKMGRGVRPASQNPYPIYEQPAG